MRFLALLGAGYLLLLTSPTAFAVTRTVTSLGDNGPGTLRDTIAASLSGDTINFSVTGVINLTSGSLAIDKALTITGPGPNLLEVTRVAGVFGLIVVTNNGAVSISGIAMTNGHSSSGGAIRSSSGSMLTLTNCILDGNTGDFGGGAISLGQQYKTASLILYNCTFTNNATGSGYGGAINAAYLTQLSASNCSLSNNNASGGGGAISLTTEQPMPLTFANCTFSNNKAMNGNGGALYSSAGISATVRLSITGCTFGGNSAGDAGGATYLQKTVGAISNSTFANNTCASGGGAVHHADSGVTVLNDTFANNSAGSGGAIYNEQFTSVDLPSTVTVSSCTLSGNTAPSGGGIYNTASNGGNAFVSLDNTILKAGASGANLTNIALGTSITSNGYNLSSDSGGGFLNSTGDQINTDPKLGPLQDNGGPTQTMALLAGSPAQDKGKATGVDQRGVARPDDIATIPNAPGGNGADIGALEMTFAPPFIVTTLSDHDDGSCSASDCTLREAVNAANISSGTNTILFSNSLAGTINLQRALGTLTVTDGVVIAGPGARVLAVSGSEDIRVFTFSSGSSTMSGLTIRDGWQTTGFSGDGASHFGGGIYNHATLALHACNFVNNYVSGANNISSGAAGGSARGGAIYNDGSLTLDSSSFSGNDSPDPNLVSGGGGGNNSAQAGAGGAGGVGEGGAVYNSGTFTATNCSFANNVAVGGAGGSDTNRFGGNGGEGTGGAIYNVGTMTLLGCTMSANQGIGGNGGNGAGLFQNGSAGASNGGVKSAASASSIVGNTIIAGNVRSSGHPVDVDGAFTSNGYNLIGTADRSTGFTAAGDQAGTDAALINATLGPLQNNGGDTDTMALLQGSRAIDAGNSFGLANEQRGLPRTVDQPLIANASGGDGTDIGAFELQTPPLGVVSSASRKTHNAAGTYDVTLPGVECRSGGVNGIHTLIITFNNSLSGIDSAAVTQGIGSVSSSAIGSDSHQYVVNLTAVANAQRILVSLTNVSDSFGNHVGQLTFSVGLLLGDSNGDGVVNSADATIARNLSGQTASAANFRSDYNSDGTINSADATVARNNSGQALPAAPSPFSKAVRAQAIQAPAELSQ